MGNSGSKKVWRTGQENPSNIEMENRKSAAFDSAELMVMRQTIQDKPEMFILNNLMMCVQFFGNYEEEIKHIKETLVSSRESELNKRLPPMKHVLLPDVLQEQVAHNVGFTSARQTFRPTIEPLQPIRIYVVHDNVDVTEQNSSSEYSSISNDVVYTTLLKPTDHQGYVRLQALEETHSILKTAIKEEEDMDLSSIAEDYDEIYSDGDSVYGPRPNSKILNKTGKLTPSKSAVSRSLPDLQDEGIGVGSYNPGSIHDVRTESDYDQRTSKRGGRNHHRNLADPSLRSVRSQWTNNNHSSASNTSSGYRSGNYAMDSDSDCSYNTMQTAPSFASQSDVSKQSASSAVSNSDIPRRCFKKVTYTNDGKIYDPRSEKKLLLNSKQRRLKLALKRHNYDVIYLSSMEFMRYFIQLFVDRLANPLGFDREAVDDVKVGGCVIYCDKVMVFRSSRQSRIDPYEIIPTIWVQWPECAQEWLNRPRSTWPDYNDVRKVKDFGCYIVPEGFTPKRGINSYEDIEWQLTFPAAERYLETCMTQCQAQVYLISLMLHKTFMRPVLDTIYGMTTSHIRNKLFWMIEENDRPSKWPDDRMGECLIKLLKSLYFSISQAEPTLTDYFVRDRNLFQRAPSEHLLHTQKQLKRIIENPVMYVFHAMENIRHSEKFFPRLDYEMLLRILTADILALVNPALTQHVSKPLPKVSSEWNEKEEQHYNRPGSFWDVAKNDQLKTNSSRTVTNKTLINPRKATDSIIEISIRCAELEGPRLSALLDFFIRHFMKIAEQCNRYGAYRQKMVYLDHADRLSILLLEHSRYTDDAREYRAKIKILKKRTKPQSAGERAKDDLPETPKRNPETAIFVGRLKDRFAKESPEQLTVEETTRKGDDSGKENVEDRSEKVTKAIVHEVRFKESENKELTKGRPSQDQKTSMKSVLKQRETPNKNEISAVSLTKRQDESFLTETTYI